MGIFKKIFKGIGKVFKKIGRGIKKAFKAFGKFMGKIGFVGQLAMMFLFPAGIGALFTKGLGQLGAKLAAVSGNGMFAKAAAGIGQVMTKAANFVTKVRSGFSSITNGIKEFGKTALGKIGINIDGAAANFFGKDSAWTKTQAGFAETGKLSEALKSGKLEVSEQINIKDLSNRVGITEGDLRRLNEGMFDKDGLIKLGSEGTATVNLNLTKGFKTNFAPVSSAQSQANIQKGLLDWDLSKMSDAEANYIKSSFGEAGFDVGGKKDAFGMDFSGLSKAEREYTESTWRALENKQQQAFEAAKRESASLAGIQPLPDAEEVFDKSLKNQRGTLVRQPDTINNLENQAVDIEKASLERGLTDKEEESWWKRFGEKTGEELDPSRTGLMRWGSNVQNLAGMFESPPDAPWGFRGSGLQDYHTGFGYQPPQPDMMQPPNNYGVQSLAEMLQYYGAYTPEQPWFLSPK